MTHLAVYGAGGCGRGIMPLLRLQHPEARLSFIDDALAGGVVNGHPVVTLAQFRASRGAAICLAIANPQLRAALAERCADLPLTEARAPGVVQMDDVTLGPGACLSPQVVLTSNIRIGRCFHANLQAYVEHDCRIGDFVTFAPGVRCNGNVTIGARASIGAGAILRQGVRIGADAVVGMGAVVTRDVPPGTTVMGNPARAMTAG